MEIIVQFSDTSILSTLSLGWSPAWTEPFKGWSSTGRLGQISLPGLVIIVITIIISIIVDHHHHRRADDAMAMGSYQGPPCQNNPCRLEAW